MKKLFFFILMAFATASLQAQIKIGVIGGVTFANQKWVSNAQNYDASITTKLKFHVGTTCDVPLSAAFSLQPEFYFSYQGSSLSQSFPLLTNYNDFNIGYLKMPVCLTYMKDFDKLFWYVGAGPYAARAVHSTTTFIQNNERINAGTLRIGRSWDDQITPYDLGLKFKTGFEIKRGINMGVYYEMGLKDINPQFVQTYNRVFGVSASYLFSITQEDKYNSYPDYYHY
jgi:hypothetical protein